MLQTDEGSEDLQEQEIQDLYGFHIENNPFLKQSGIQKEQTTKHGPDPRAEAGKKYAGTSGKEQQKALRKKHRIRKQQHIKAAEQKAENLLVTLVRKVLELLARHAVLAVTLSVVLSLLLILIVLLFLILGFFANSSSSLIYGSYNSAPAELDGADASLTEKELALQRTIENIETDHPGFDEYRYDLDPIGHDPVTLINYLSAIHGEFTASGVESEISALFDEMYELTLTETEETRTRTVTNEEGEEEEEEYTVQILEVKLESTSLESIVAGWLSGDALLLYQTYRQTGGALQVFYTPLDMDWQSAIASYYGHRKDPRTGLDQFHRGVDIAVTEGTEVYAAQDGTVTVAGSDPDYGLYIVIENERGYVSKYAHLSVINVSAGETVSHGAVIGKTGSTGSVTGSHLHLECLYRGEYYNPLFYFQNGNGSLFGTDEPAGGDGSAVLAEAERYLGYPYVWGGSTPETSFDCSGFVCWVFTNSGAFLLPRTTAQGIYNRSHHITASEARPGDLIFFTGTYHSGNPVTHVGIYCGNGKMIHAGSPIKVSSVTTPYWQSHLYGWGRLLE